MLRSCSAGGYLGVNALDQRIERQTSPDDAWIFHTHEGAVNHARWIGEVHGETPDVVKLISELNGGGDQPWMKLRRRRDSAA